MSVKVAANYTCNGCGAKATVESRTAGYLNLPKGWTGSPLRVGGRVRRPVRRSSNDLCGVCKRAVFAALDAAIKKRKGKKGKR